MSRARATSTATATPTSSSAPSALTPAPRRRPLLRRLGGNFRVRHPPRHPGSDTLIGADAADVLIGGCGNDVVLRAAAVAVDVLYGGDGDDVIELRRRFSPDRRRQRRRLAWSPPRDHLDLTTIPDNKLTGPSAIDLGDQSSSLIPLPPRPQPPLAHHQHLTIHGGPSDPACST
ncbi:MAG: hypothetical protein IPK80_00795 [Nannocystis sp.]|nr:hypothetical protein [Nannocystis sp.]